MEGQEGGPKGQEELKILVEKTGEAIELYRQALQSGSEEFQRKDLADRAKESLNKHLSELELLSEMLKELSLNPQSFEIAVNVVDANNNKTIFKLKRKRDDLSKTSSGQPQMQLRFEVKNAGSEGERERIEALSLGGQDPSRVLEKVLDQTQSTVVSTNSVYRDKETRQVKSSFQAGITFSRRGKNFIRSAGVVFVGGEPHVDELSDHNLGDQEFFALMNFVLKIPAKFSQHRTRL